MTDAPRPNLEKLEKFAKDKRYRAVWLSKEDALTVVSRIRTLEAENATLRRELAAADTSIATLSAGDVSGVERMSESVQIECKSCDGTGLYIGVAEHDGAAVVCYRCKGTGEDTITFARFIERRPPTKPVSRVHVARGYVLSPNHPDCAGGVAYQDWTPGMDVPADERLYCPMVYTNQEYCAFRTEDGDARPGIGQRIADCEYWHVKAACWVRYHADGVPGKVS
jgi:urease gamma subunit